MGLRILKSFFVIWVAVMGLFSLSYAAVEFDSALEGCLAESLSAELVGTVFESSEIEKFSPRDPAEGRFYVFYGSSAEDKKIRGRIFLDKAEVTEANKKVTPIKLCSIKRLEIYSDEIADYGDLLFESGN